MLRENVGDDFGGGYAEAGSGTWRRIGCAGFGSRWEVGRLCAEEVTDGASDRIIFAGHAREALVCGVGEVECGNLRDRPRGSFDDSRLPLAAATAAHEVYE